MNPTDGRLGKSEGFVGGKALTLEQWRVQLPPMCWHRVSFASWTDSHYTLAYRWAAMNSTEWVYFDDKTFYFGSKGDATLFMLWLTEHGVDDDMGEL